MTATGRDALRNMFMEGVSQGYRYMLIVYDNITKEFYPVYCHFGDYEITAATNSRFGRKIAEVYDLTHSMAWQIQQRRTMNVPFSSRFRQGWCEQANS